MEVSGYILDAITHAVRAVDRRSDGLQSVADRHSRAVTAALNRWTADATTTGSGAGLRETFGEASRGLK